MPLPSHTSRCATGLRSIHGSHDDSAGWHACRNHWDVRTREESYEVERDSPGITHPGTIGREEGGWGRLCVGEGGHARLCLSHSLTVNSQAAAARAARRFRVRWKDGSHDRAARRAAVADDLPAQANNASTNPTPARAAAALPPAIQWLRPTQPSSNRNVPWTYRPMPATVPSFQDHFMGYTPLAAGGSVSCVITTSIYFSRLTPVRNRWSCPTTRFDA